VTDAYEQERKAMVADQIAWRGIDEPSILAAMAAVPRHLFVPAAAREQAYRDEPIAIGFGQTISQPYIVALMTSLVRAGGRGRESEGHKPTILEIGCGCGYQTAVLAQLGCRVVALELLAPLADRARLTLASLGMKDLVVLCRDGRQGAADHAPPGGFDGILVAAASATVPPALLEQLAIGARLVIPLGSADGAQELVVIERQSDGLVRETVIAVRFVPLV